jgi:hypothetical protein
MGVYGVCYVLYCHRRVRRTSAKEINSEKEQWSGPNLILFDPILKLGVSGAALSDLTFMLSYTFLKSSTSQTGVILIQVN